MVGGADILTGQCLCGQVRITARAKAPGVSGCHCGMCRRWTGIAFFSLEATDVTVEGPVASYRSSSFATRAWCGTCGTHLWLKDDDGPYEFLPGLFGGAADYPLTSEIYIDRRPAWLPLSGDHPRRTGAEYEAGARHVPGDC